MLGNSGFVAKSVLPRHDSIALDVTRERRLSGFARSDRAHPRIAIDAPRERREVLRLRSGEPESDA